MPPYLQSVVDATVDVHVRGVTTSPQGEACRDLSGHPAQARWRLTESGTDPHSLSCGNTTVDAAWRGQARGSDCRPPRQTLCPVLVLCLGQSKETGRVMPGAAEKVPKRRRLDANDSGKANLDADLPLSFSHNIPCYHPSSQCRYRKAAVVTGLRAVRRTSLPSQAVSCGRIDPG